MQEILLVIDMQNDFVDGVLGTGEARAIVPGVVEKIRNFPGKVFFTQDTHGDNYLNTQEGRNLPVPHCIKGTYGWQLCPAVAAVKSGIVVEKPGFGSPELVRKMQEEHAKDPIGQITLIGLCTDICVITSAMALKAFLPEVPLVVDSACCAGVTPASHETALQAMAACQIKIVR